MASLDPRDDPWSGRFYELPLVLGECQTRCAEWFDVPLTDALGLATSTVLLKRRTRLPNPARYCLIRSCCG